MAEQRLQNDNVGPCLVIGNNQVPAVRTKAFQPADFPLRFIDARKQEGISFLLIDMSTPGVSVNPIVTIDGGHDVNEVHLENVEVPLANLVGEEG